MEKETRKHKRLRKQVSKILATWKRLKPRDIEKIKVALARGLDPNSEHTTARATLLEWACQMKQFEAVKIFIQAGADVNRYVNEVPLRRASSCYNLASFLIDNGADVNYKDDTYDKASIIHGLAETKEIYFNDSIWRLFLRAGADVNAQDKYGQTAIMRALAKKNYSAANFLKENGADLSIKDNAGRTAADYIEDADKRKADIINSLLNN